MARFPVSLHCDHPLTVGSIGDAACLRSLVSGDLENVCDLIEIRLDLLAAEGLDIQAALWSHLPPLPVLFTARRDSEGGAGDLSAADRIGLLNRALDDASLIDIEVASITEMQPLIADLRRRSIPWIASAHYFDRAPEIAELEAGRMAARNAGAAAYKAAVQLGWDADRLAPLAFFVRSSERFPTALMGMGPLAPVSRVLFAQLGSVLNYGYLGETPTAPGQWSARQLREAIHSVQKPAPLS